MKPSSKQVPAVKVAPRKPSSDESAVADRTVEAVVTGLNTFKQTGRFPKVY
jgi:hypothetical protein